MREKILSYLKKYLVAFAAMGLVTGLILYVRDISSAETISLRYRILADAFTTPSIVILMVGLLVWVAGEGTFDMISYGLGRGLNSLLPFRQQTDETFYDYKKRKMENRKKGYAFLFISGGVYFIPALIFNILFYCL